MKEIVVMSLICAALIGLLIKAVIVEQREWDAFSVAHECKIVGQAKGHASTGVGFGATGSGGQMGTIITTSRTPDTTGWLCNDGVTYWR